MSNVHTLPGTPNQAIAENPATLAKRLRAIADLIDAGNYPGLWRLAIVMDTGDAIDIKAYGPPMTNSDLVGYLEFAKMKAMGY